jgi:hypothetical protein
VRRRARDPVALSEVIEDAVDEGGPCDEADHAHFAPAARTHERVDFVDPADQLRPSTPEGGAVRPVRYRCLLGCLARGGGLLALGAGGVRVGAAFASTTTPTRSTPGSAALFGGAEPGPLSEEPLGRSLIHIRQRDLRPGSRPASPGTKRVDVQVELRPLAEGLDHRSGRASKSSWIWSRTCFCPRIIWPWWAWLAFQEVADIPGFQSRVCALTWTSRRRNLHQVSRDQARTRNDRQPPEAPG